MDIILGYDFDTGAYPDALSSIDALQAQDAVSGKAVLGPTGLLSVLETRLGLKGPKMRPAVRVGQYLDSLRAADDGRRFYSLSFAADAWSTARELLTWRDKLVMSGWDKTIPADAPRRLADLAAVEAEAANRLSPGLGERLRAVCKSLQESPGTGIDRVFISEPEKYWPWPWQNLFFSMAAARIDCTFAECVFSGAQAVRAAGDLGRLQGCLGNARKSGQSIAGDGSLMLVVGQTEADAAEALAEWLAADKASNSGVVLVKSMGSRLLDESLHRMGLPRLGTDSRSRWRAALQVLLLAIENAWRPVNPHLLLEILTLPYSPVPRRAGWYFVQALKDRPGIGGTSWHEARAQAVAHEQERLEKEALSPQRAAKKRKAFEENLDFWLGLERFDPDEGMPAQAALKICARVARLVTVKGGHEGDPLLLQAMEQAMELEAAVKASNLERITRAQLNRMVDEVFQFSGAAPGSGAEAATWHTVKTPGQVRGPADTVIWWGFVDSPGRHTPHIWTRSEQKALAAAGVRMEEPREKRRREAILWQRPVMMAKNRLMLVTYRTEAAEPASPHPLWEEIRQAVLHSAADEQRVILDAGALRSRPELPFGAAPDARVVKRVEKAPLQLPAAAWEWAIPSNAVCFRDAESASSLEKLVNCPLAWVLTYHARIRKGALLSLPQDLRLAGILAHAVVERLLNASGPLTPLEAREKAAAIYEHLLPQIAAEWLQPGRAVERQRYRENIAEAASALVRLLQDSALSVDGTEKPFSRVNSRMGVRVNGILDLLVKDPAGATVVMDLKWAMTSKYRREEIRNGDAVQLATYAWLLGADESPSPSAGYYMLAQKELLALDVSCFPGQAATAGPSLTAVWDNIVATSTDNMKALQSGVAKAPGAEADADGNAKTCRFCEYGMLCGVHQEEGI